jgi:hypothetical protein
MGYKSVLLMGVKQDKRQFVNCVRVQDGKTILELLSVILAKVLAAWKHVIVPLVRVKVLAHVIMSVMKVKRTVGLVMVMELLYVLIVTEMVVNLVRKGVMREYSIVSIVRKDILVVTSVKVITSSVRVL